MSNDGWREIFGERFLSYGGDGNEGRMRGVRRHRSYDDPMAIHGYIADFGFLEVARISTRIVNHRSLSVRDSGSQ